MDKERLKIAISRVENFLHRSANKMPKEAMEDLILVIEASNEFLSIKEKEIDPT